MQFTKKRNYSLREYWIQTAASIEPQLAYRPGMDFAAWHAEALAKLKELAGDFPTPTEPDVQVEYSVIDGDIVRERVTFNVEAFLSVPCLVLYPKGMKKDGGNPAIVCSHGHGPYGKDAVAGHACEPEAEAHIAKLNYDYALQMAKAGFFTLSPDLRGFGERLDRDGTLKPGRDFCNVNLLRGMLLDMYPLTGNVWDIMKCVDYLETRPEVDPKRIGMMGLSGGGTMAAFGGALEPRFKAVDIICYASSFKTFGVDRGNICGMQLLPGILRWLDVADVSGLIAPRPLLIEAGVFDDCFPFEDALPSVLRVKEIYEGAGAADRFETDLFPGPHAFGGNKAFDFFRKYL